jgi:hypothetical protein
VTIEIGQSGLTVVTTLVRRARHDRYPQATVPFPAAPANPPRLNGVRINVALAAAVISLALTGCACSADDPPDPPPTSTSAAPTPTAPAPTLPTTARADSPAGAEAFARYWLTALDYAYQTGNSQPLRNAGTCQGCTALADSIDRVYSRGGYIEGGRITILETKARRYTPGRPVEVEAYYAQANGTTVYGDGRSTPTPGSARLGFLFALGRTNDRWSVDSIKTIRKDR